MSQVQALTIGIATQSGRA